MRRHPSRVKATQSRQSEAVKGALEKETKYERTQLLSLNASTLPFTLIRRQKKEFLTFSVAVGFHVALTSKMDKNKSYILYCITTRKEGEEEIPHTDRLDRSHGRDSIVSMRSSVHLEAGNKSPKKHD